jgi:hypothetical protein
MFTPKMCHEIRDCINEIRRETRTRVIVITGAGDKFFCIGGRKEGMEDTLMYAGVLPTLEMYEAIDKLQKPVIAMVNGFAVGGGNVLQVVCDITIAKESAVFRQVGPMMGSFDGGYGTWYLEDLIGKKRAKEMWYRNPKLTAREAQEWGSSTTWCRTRNCRTSPARSRWRSPTAAPSRWLRSRRPSTRATAACRACRAWRTTCCCAATWRPTSTTSWPPRWRKAQAGQPTSSATESIKGIRHVAPVDLA